MGCYNSLEGKAPADGETYMAAKVVSFINLKGGVGKSTLSMMVSEYLYFRFNQRVLVIDIDSQANLTSAMVSNDRIEELKRDSRTIYHLFWAALTGSADLLEVVARPPLVVSNIARGLVAPSATLDMVVSAPDLAQLDEDMLEMWENGEVAPTGFRYVLRRALEPIIQRYDVIIIDCPPGLSVLTSNALVASDYYVAPLIPEPLSKLGIDLVRDRVRGLNDREGLNIQFAGSILNKVMYYRKSHGIEAPKLYGAQVGNNEPEPYEHYYPFRYWIPDAEAMRKLGDFENEDLGTGKFDSVNAKYRSTGPLRNNPGSYLSRDAEEGTRYNLYDRLERVVLEFTERIDLSM